MTEHVENYWRDAMLEEMDLVGDGGATNPFELMKHIVDTNILYHLDSRISRPAGELRNAADQLEAWFLSGNDIPVDTQHLLRTKGDAIIRDIETLIAAARGILTK